MLQNNFVSETEKKQRTLKISYFHYNFLAFKEINWNSSPILINVKKILGLKCHGMRFADTCNKLFRKKKRLILSYTCKYSFLSNNL